MTARIFAVECSAPVPASGKIPPCIRFQEPPPYPPPDEIKFQTREDMPRLQNGKELKEQKVKDNRPD